MARLRDYAAMGSALKVHLRDPVTMRLALDIALPDGRRVGGVFTGVVAPADIPRLATRAEFPCVVVEDPLPRVRLYVRRGVGDERLGREYITLTRTM